jgi:hypothetical protein
MVFAGEGKHPHSVYPASAGTLVVYWASASTLVHHNA